MGWLFCDDVYNLSINCDLQRNLSSAPIRILQTSRFERISHLYVISFLGVVGLLGNALSVLILRRDPLRRRSLFMLQVLAVADICYLLAAIGRYPAKHLLSPNQNAVLQFFVFPLLKTLQTTGVWIMVLVTLDRFLNVRWPLRARTWLTHRRRKGAVTLVAMAAVLYNTPRFMDKCIHRFHDNCRGSVNYQLFYRRAFFRTVYLDGYEKLMYLALLYVGPLLLLTGMNRCLIDSIRRSRRFQRGAASVPAHHVTSDRSATLVLVIIVLVFLVCQTPELFLRCLTLLDRVYETRFLSKTCVLHLHVLSETVMVLNSATNFFIYIAFGKRFRYVMKETFRYLAQTSGSLVTRESAPLHALNNNHMYA